MANPITSLLVFGLIIIAGLLLFIPRYGLISLWRKSKSDKKKILIEDSLKFIYDMKMHNKACYKEKLALALDINAAKLDALIKILTNSNLITLSEDKIDFTEEGKSYAVKVVRIHRLLEKYFAEETSIKEDYWHKVAEDKEHTISEEEAENLSARLGNPFTDPHGDPIPLPTGEQFEKESILLPELQIGDVGIISHIEDEPTEIYSSLKAKNLTLGTMIKLSGKGEEKLEVEAGGRLIELTIREAENISLSEAEIEAAEEASERLSELRENESAVIVGISRAMRGQQRRRLLDFGFVPGTRVSVRLVSLGNDPVAYDIRNTTVAIRRQQAELVFVKRESKGNGNE